MIKRPLGGYKFAAGNWANQCPTGMFRRENEFTKGPDSIAKEYSPGFDGELRLSTLPHGAYNAGKARKEEDGNRTCVRIFRRRRARRIAAVWTAGPWEKDLRQPKAAGSSR